MKITIVADSFVGYMGTETSGEIFGGQEILLKHTCEVLIDEGHEVTVIQFGKEELDFYYGKVKIRQVKEKKYPLLQKFGFIRRWTWAGLLLNKKIEKDCEWIHFHNHHFSFPRALNKNVILTGMNHGVEWDVPWVYEKFTLKNLRDRFAFFLLKSVTKFSINNLDKIITNDYFFVHFATLKSPQLLKNFNYIPNFADTNIFHPNIEPSKKILQLANGSKIILLPKMAMKERGTDIMIDVIKDLRELDIILVITGVSFEINDWKNYVKKLNLEHKVIFTGHIDYFHELPSIYSAADIVVIPSPCREATAIAMLEGMAMRKPMVISNIGGLTEVAKDGYNSLVCNSNTAEFKTAILKLLHDQALSTFLSQNAYDFVTKAYNYEIWRERITNFFKLSNVGK
jgi:glycosyltransferase involved in cell wall biosynthesis